MTFAFDEPPTVEARNCDLCGRQHRLIKAFVLKDRTAHSVVFAALHRHEDVSEAWMDVILGTFSNDASDDHVTFGCRVGPVAGQDEPAASLVQAAVPYSDAPIWGRKLTRTEALSHSRLQDFWDVVDFVLTDQPVVHDHVYGT